MRNVKQVDLKQKSGIYLIVNKINGKKYVGSSIDIYTRLRTHISKLLRQKHNNICFQRSFNKYGELNFKASILEYCNKNMLRKSELKWINKLNPEYNLQRNPREYNVSKESRKKISDTLKQKYKSGEIKSFNHPDKMTSIKVYDFNYKLIGEFESISKACRKLTFLTKGGLVGCIRNKKPYYNNYIVIPSSIDNEEAYIKDYYRRKMIKVPIIKIGYGIIDKSPNGEYGMAKRRLNKSPFNIITIGKDKFCFLGFQYTAQYK